MNNRAVVYLGHVIHALRQLPESSVHCVVTSPPYWGLRDYGLSPIVWDDPGGCEHEWGGTISPPKPEENRTAEEFSRASTLGPNRDGLSPSNAAHRVRTTLQPRAVSAFCLRCSAWRGSLGLEPTPDLYVQHLVAIFREIRRVLRDDGTVWLNLGDCYCTIPHGPKEKNAPQSFGGGGSIGRGQERSGPASDGGGYVNRKPLPGLKHKDLIGIPWRVAFALQADGWWLRSDIIWFKPNPMPESVTDRPTKSHEYVFLLSKAPTYYYDAEAIKEPAVAAGENRGGWKKVSASNRFYPPGSSKQHLDQYGTTPATRNRRTVWTIATKPFKEAHFAVFPPTLVAPCVQAGTSERGCCPTCGAPWERVVERRPLAERDDTGRTHGLAEQRRTSPGAPPEKGWQVEYTTVGWCPTCPHYPRADEWPDIPPRLEDEPEDLYEGRVALAWELRRELLSLWSSLAAAPCVVLDPFMGSGTVAEVAHDLGRSSVGAELNPAYVEIMRRRLGNRPLEVRQVLQRSPVPRRSK